jgi:hypothetical protein
MCACDHSAAAYIVVQLSRERIGAADDAPGRLRVRQRWVRVQQRWHVRSRSAVRER